jgi:hypothetical protein
MRPDCYHKHLKKGTGRVLCQKQTIEDTVKKSRFIGVIVPCGNEQEVGLNLKNLHLEHPNASHIAHAYRLKTDHGLVYRFHDVGEPAETAGKPIFQHLEGEGINQPVDRRHSLFRRRQAGRGRLDPRLRRNGSLRPRKSRFTWKWQTLA